MTLKQTYDVVVIGSGPGGLAAAIEAKKAGADDVLIIERAREMGGAIQLDVALVQLSPPDHNGFCTLGTSVDAAKAAGVGELRIRQPSTPR